MIVCNALNSSPQCLINLHTLDPIAFEILAVKTFCLLRLKAELLILFAKFNFGRELYYFFANFYTNNFEYAQTLFYNCLQKLNSLKIIQTTIFCNRTKGDIYYTAAAVLVVFVTPLKLAPAVHALGEVILPPQTTPADCQRAREAMEVHSSTVEHSLSRLNLVLITSIVRG